MGQTLAAGLARPTRDRRVDGDTLAGVVAGGNDPTDLVAEHQGSLDRVAADPAFDVLVAVGSAQADRADLQQELARLGGGHGLIGQAKVARAVEPRRPVHPSIIAVCVADDTACQVGGMRSTVQVH
jgi:hypothetical protein